MKAEFKGKIVSEFAGLKSEMYSLVSADDEEVTKAKVANSKQKIKNLLMFCLIKRW